eukprot:7017132-Karenia_brevis.AAC.1
METYRTYTSEVYGVLVSLTGGEAKGILKKMDDMGGDFDGCKALLSTRFDPKTVAGLFQTYLGVVSPAPIKGIGDIPEGIQTWESK